MSTSDELREKWKQFWREYDRAHKAWLKLPLPRPTYPRIPFPDELKGLTCGAHARRTGKPCRRRDINKGARCPLHGGMSTGPRTPEGKARSSQNWKRRRNLCTNKLHMDFDNH
ncbi:MAG TPA: HGGxSTG domain-containing protein [Deltaproteobacteria bacterium]|nr:HGGxSTG domain-containing protein [Deltaproteobacteria bacterium]